MLKFTGHTSQHHRSPGESLFSALHGFTVSVGGKVRGPHLHEPFVAINASWRSWEDDSLMVPYVTIVRQSVDKDGHARQRIISLNIGNAVWHAEFYAKHTWSMARAHWFTLREQGAARYLKRQRRALERWLQSRQEQREERQAYEAAYACETLEEMGLCQHGHPFEEACARCIPNVVSCPHCIITFKDLPPALGGKSAEQGLVDHLKRRHNIEP